MSRRHHKPPPAFLRWTDYLTSKSCILRVEPEDVEAQIGKLISDYLAVPDAGRLVSDRRLLPNSLPPFEAFQDITLALSDDGVPGSLIPGAVLRDGPRELNLSETAPRELALLNGSYAHLLEVTIDRSETGYARNWRGFAKRRWARNRSAFQKFIENAASDETEPGVASPAHSCTENVSLLRRLAKSVWESPFENYSRFTGMKSPYKTGDETLLNIIDGHGAICSEKVQALKFLTDTLGFESRYVFAGPGATGRLPGAELRRVLETFDFQDARQAMRYWQHIALEYTVDDRHILVDATNGNIPFLFIEGDERKSILNENFPQPVPVRMGTYWENFYYHRAPDDLALDLCYAMENYIPEIDLAQVFDNELGLIITPEFLVAPVPFKTDDDFQELCDLYDRLAAPDGLETDVRREWNLDGPLWESFCSSYRKAANAILNSRDHLLERYDTFEGFGHQMGLAIVNLKMADE